MSWRAKDLINDLVMLNLFMWCIVPSLVAELCVHVAVLVKQTRIESRATVYVVKNNVLVSRQRHQVAGIITTFSGARCLLNWLSTRSGPKIPAADYS